MSVDLSLIVPLSRYGFQNVKSIKINKFIHCPCVVEMPPDYDLFSQLRDDMDHYREPGVRHYKVPRFSVPRGVTVFYENGKLAPDSYVPGATAPEYVLAKDLARIGYYIPRSSTLEAREERSTMRAIMAFIRSMPGNTPVFLHWH